jgi:hypothetical protein
MTCGYESIAFLATKEFIHEYDNLKCTLFNCFTVQRQMKKGAAKILKGFDFHNYRSPTNGYEDTAFQTGLVKPYCPRFHYLLIQQYDVDPV